MEITALTFPYNTDIVTRKQFDNHITLYEGYVSKTNEITKALAAKPDYKSANATVGRYRGWKKGETYALNGVILHELYFQNLGAESEPIGAKIRQLMERNFGSVEKWQEDFVACAKSARGWCVFCYEQRTASCRNILLDFHDQGNIAIAYPLLVLDMYEHAYFMDYGADKDSYIERFIDNIPWGTIEKRANRLQGVTG